jgi:hypothetical protein
MVIPPAPVGSVGSTVVPSFVEVDVALSPAGRAQQFVSIPDQLEPPRDFLLLERACRVALGSSDVGMVELDELVVALLDLTGRGGAGKMEDLEGAGRARAGELESRGGGGGGGGGV